MGQPVAFFEIISPDAERALKFYTEMFGWAAQADPNMGGYALVDTNAGEGAIGGGIGGTEAPGEAPTVKIYMRVDDLDAALDRAERLGGKRLVPPTDLPEGYGRFAIFTDPDGNQVGLWA
ncbi:MAG TPA: VOC family protein [Trebonia sp.]|jgi:predicted enzyme related to lactoylglutathione lyase|nr:VOC family protein [Trebonia sp.]